MTDPAQTLLKLTHETKAVSIWNRQTGPVFWYAASVPGPFYVNTELVIGPELAETLLNKITAIVGGTTDAAQRAAQLNAAILAAYDANPAYRQVIAAMTAAAKAAFPAGSYDVVSGGERRDWLFSIPFARECGARHLFLFKDQSFYCEQGIKAGETALHVADLINNAASYFDLWLPILQKADVACAGTVCLNSRGTNGLERLAAAKVKVVALNSIDLGFFAKSRDSGLIDAGTYAELESYFAAPKLWAAKYLMQDAALFDVARTDAKSFTRLQSFFTNDPWGLRPNHATFFAAMDEAIAARAGTAAKKAG
ncbi:hypothetical protein [Propionivibrio sp.]|uniref:hypothetical protein n=1 Tax=Propionivibrio sp. TaxID=2212460 RepID=UPI00262FB42F|nr:hypothetical protein [Propionivibrio sp.]